MRLSVLASLGTPESPSQAAVAAAGVWAADEYAELGHDDFSYSARELAATYADQARQRRVMVLAHDGDRCVGLASVEYPQTLDPPTLVREWQFWRLWGLPGVIPGVGMG